MSRRSGLVPANRFEVLECRAAIDAVAENAQDTPPLRTGASMCWRPAAPSARRSLPTNFLPRVRARRPMPGSRARFDAAVDFVAIGGYALKAYERFRQDQAG